MISYVSKRCPLGEHYPSASGQVVGSIHFIRGKSRRILSCPLRRDHLYPQSFRLIILNWGHNYNVMIIIKLTRVSSLLFLLSIGLPDLPQQKVYGLIIPNVWKYFHLFILIFSLLISLRVYLLCYDEMEYRKYIFTTPVWWEKCLFLLPNVSHCASFSSLPCQKYPLPLDQEITTCSL